MALAQNEHAHQWSGIEDPDANPHTYGYLIFDKEGRDTPWIKKDSIFNNGPGQTGYLHVEDPYLSLYTKLNSKWI